MNAAARLCAKAAPGQLLASAVLVEVAALPTDAWTSVGAVELKGFPAPVYAAQISWHTEGASGSVPLPSALDVSEGYRLVGRRDDLAALDAAWARAAAPRHDASGTSSGQAQVVVVHGEPPASVRAGSCGSSHRAAIERAPSCCTAGVPGPQHRRPTANGPPRSPKRCVGTSPPRPRPISSASSVSTLRCFPRSCRRCVGG